MSVRYDINLDRGATYRFSFVYGIENESTGEFTPYDLTGCTFTLNMRDSRRTITFDMSSSVVLDDDNETVLVHLTPAQTMMYGSHTQYYYVLDTQFPSGDVNRLMEGAIYPSPVK